MTEQPSRRRLNRHFIRAGVALAPLAALAAASPRTAEAAIFYSGPVGINIPTNTSGVYLNLLTGATGSSTSLAGWDLNPWGTTGLSLFNSTTTGQTVATQMIGSGSVASVISAGALIGPSSSFTTTVGVQSISGLAFNSLNYLGFKFWSESASMMLYGWVRISLSDSATSQPRTIYDYAFEDTGLQLTAGFVPAPTAAAALALGALTARRRRRQ